MGYISVSLTREPYHASGPPSRILRRSLLDQPPAPGLHDPQSPLGWIVAEGVGHVPGVAAHQEVAEAAGVAVVVEELRAPLVPLRQQVVPASAGAEARRGLEQL